MKVVLKENVKGVGQRGEVKEVKDGYAMNFLIPQNKAVPATNDNVRQAELIQKKNKEQIEKEIAEAKKLSEKIQAKTITISAKAQKEKLFGALTEEEIVTALQKEGLSIGQGKIKTKGKIKKLGEHDIVVEWVDGIKADFKLLVEELK